MDTDRQSWNIADGVSWVAIDEHLAVGACLTGDIHLLNPTAALIWACLADGNRVDGAALALANAYGIPFDRTNTDVSRMVRAWEDASLLNKDGVSSPVERLSLITAETCQNFELVRTSDYCVGGVGFRIRYWAGSDIDEMGRASIERLIAIFSGLACSSTGHADYPGSEIDYRIGRSYFSVASQSDYWQSDSILDAQANLQSVILRTVYSSVDFDWLCNVHAATLAWDGTTIMLPAPTGHGKSTLAAYLVGRGWTYFSDDTTAVAPQYYALPLPTAIGLKSGSLPALNRLYPNLCALPEHAYGGKVARYLAPAQAKPTCVPSEISAMIFPKYELGAEPSLKRLSAPQAATLIMEAGVSFGGTLTPAKLQWLASLVTRTPCWSLGYGSLPEAEALLGSVAKGL